MEKVSPSSGSDSTAVPDSDSFFFDEMEQKDDVEEIQVPSQDSFVKSTAKAACEIANSVRRLSVGYVCVYRLNICTCV